MTESVRLSWGKREKDWVVRYPDNSGRSVMNEIVKKLEEYNMNVHEIDHGSPGFKYPFALLIKSTHFIMKDDKIVHVGTVKTIENFVNNYEQYGVRDFFLKERK